MDADLPNYMKVIISIRLVGEDIEHVHPFEMDNEVSYSDLMKIIENITLIPPVYQKSIFRGEVLPIVERPLLDIRFGEELIVKHSHIVKWSYYCDKVEEVLKNKNAPNRQYLISSASSIHETLTASNFFKTYESFEAYRDRNHWRIVKYLDGETTIIAAAAREHFAGLNILRGGSENDYHFEYVPKDSTGTRSGIILKVKLSSNTTEMSKWQVKTHHHGGSTFNSDITGPDIRELFCYKMFELIGVGAEVRFIMPSEDLSSKTAVYIGTRWREDFVPLFTNETCEAPVSKESIVQLHLLQVIFHVEDLHGLNCGTWKELKTAAVVDFCMGVERKNPRKIFLQKYNSRLAWDDRSKEVLENTTKQERLDIAKKSLEKWSIIEKMDEADNCLTQLKDVLKKKFATRFRGFDTDEDDEIYNSQVTNDLKAYIDLLKSNVEIFLK